ncbi:FAD-dependent monooxygenase [Streptomyces sp. NPDC001777]|uniref:FAD-dependent monooxygenase n=1 Tax=Streptomyces sp. NPDC001777 TaxID=3364608 RepID=UPI0036C7A58A
MAGRMHAQVMVVGGGPVGMLVAAELAAQGVDTLVLEAEAATSERPRATTLHARAVQCLARRGYFFAPEPRPAGGAAAMPFHFAGIPGLSITAPGTEPVPILKAPQAELERLFESRARANGVRVLREHRVTDMTQDRDGVLVTAQGPQGCRSFAVAYVVGADGARSTVREMAGIASDVGLPTMSALTGLVRVPDPRALPVGWHRTPRGWLIAKKGPDGRTLVHTLTEGDASDDRHQPLTLAELNEKAAWVAGRDIEMADPRWLGRFSDYTRLARTYRARRFLLAGDAAHVHFPIGGQGLSTGVLDALDLSWKLGLVARGAAGDGLLDTYGPERRPAARRVIDNTRAQVALMRSGTEVDSLRALLAGLLESGRGNDFLSAMISAQDTVLPSSPRRRYRSLREGTFLDNIELTTAQGPSDVIGLLGRSGRPLLLLLGEGGGRCADTARTWARSLHVVHCAPTASLPYDALLVRPDGYVAWASDGGEPLADALVSLFGTEAEKRAGTDADVAVAPCPEALSAPAPVPAGTGRRWHPSPAGAPRETPAPLA